VIALGIAGEGPTGEPTHRPIPQGDHLAITLNTQNQGVARQGLAPSESLPCLHHLFVSLPMLVSQSGHTPVSASIIGDKNLKPGGVRMSVIPALRSRGSQI
jgi:hypothetical protein